MRPQAKDSRPTPEPGNGQGGQGPAACPPCSPRRGSSLTISSDRFSVLTTRATQGHPLARLPDLLHSPCPVQALPAITHGHQDPAVWDPNPPMSQAAPHPVKPATPWRLHPVLHSQARDAGAVVGELLVAGHAVDIDDVDDRVLRADPHLALLRHHHAVLLGQGDSIAVSGLCVACRAAAPGDPQAQVPAGLRPHHCHAISTSSLMCISV